jgi:hypothetical protein
MTKIQPFDFEISTIALHSTVDEHQAQQKTQGILTTGLETNFSACQSSRTDRLKFLPVRRKIIQSATYTEIGKLRRMKK